MNLENIVKNILNIRNALISGAWIGQTLEEVYFQNLLNRKNKGIYAGLIVQNTQGNRFITGATEVNWTTDDAGVFLYPIDDSANRFQVEIGENLSKYSVIGYSSLSRRVISYPSLPQQEFTAF